MPKDLLFPELPSELAKLSDEELSTLLAEFETAAKLIEANDSEFLDGFTGEEVLEQFKAGALSIMALREEQGARVKAAEDYEDGIAQIARSIQPEAKAETEGDGDGDGDGDGEGAEKAEVKAEATSDEVKAEAEESTSNDDPGDETDKAEEKEPVLVASAEEKDETPEEKPAPVARVRRPVPVPAADRVVVNEPDALAFVASGYVDSPPGTKFNTPGELAEAVHKAMKSIGRPSKRPDGREERYLVASLDYSGNYPEERRLTADFVANGEKIAAIGNPYLGRTGIEALVASGGFCAPLQPIYTMPQLATNARPVRDALPNFRAERGGINVPTPTTMGDATGAITVITEAEDALGGTFATKACLDMDCPEYVETAVTIISHCREFGNLNAMAWPEKIRHENELTMAEHARVAESYLLTRIKAQSIAVTAGATTLGALIYLVDALEKAEFGMRSRLRLPSEQRFQVLAPRVLLDVLELDTISTQFDRYRGQAAIEGYLADLGFDITWYIDTASPRPGVPDGTSQIADAAQAAGALDGFPASYDLAFFPAGTFLHLDMAELNFGIVRDSTLNSTNDFQVFGEVFENVARIGPAQAAYWMTLDICPTGAFPPAGTVRSCE